jgi:hypothetical protein
LCPTSYSIDFFRENFILASFINKNEEKLCSESVLEDILEEETSMKQHSRRKNFTVATFMKKYFAIAAFVKGKHPVATFTKKKLCSGNTKNKLRRDSMHEEKLCCSSIHEGETSLLQRA